MERTSSIYMIYLFLKVVDLESLIFFFNKCQKEIRLVWKKNTTRTERNFSKLITCLYVSHVLLSCRVCLYKICRYIYSKTMNLKRMTPFVWRNSLRAVWSTRVLIFHVAWWCWFQKLIVLIEFISENDRDFKMF